MPHPIRAFALALALAATPACAAFEAPRLENPVAAARSVDQRAYALLHAYGAIVEEARDVVADPESPLALKRALGQAERAATPAAETLQIAVVAYVRARSDFDAAAHADQSAIARAGAALTAATRHLGEALTAAERPVGELEALVQAARR